MSKERFNLITIRSSVNAQVVVTHSEIGRKPRLNIFLDMARTLTSEVAVGFYPRLGEEFKQCSLSISNIELVNYSVDNSTLLQPRAVYRGGQTHTPMSLLNHDSYIIFLDINIINPRHDYGVSYWVDRLVTFTRARVFRRNLSQYMDESSFKLTTIGDDHSGLVIKSTQDLLSLLNSVLCDVVVGGLAVNKEVNSTMCDNSVVLDSGVEVFGSGVALPIYCTELATSASGNFTEGIMYIGEM